MSSIAVTMTNAQVFLWIALPYLSIAIFVVGHIWRYRRDQFGWTSRSTQLLERRLLAWGSPMFHYGALAVIGGHILGILIPASVTGAIGIDEHAYHLIAMYAGNVSGWICAIGLIILIYRRVKVDRITHATSRVDLLVYFMLLVMIGLGMADTVGANTIGSSYNYRESVAVWFRGIFSFEPHVALMVHAPFEYKAHAVAAWVFFALFPFSRLVHVWSFPLQYLGRPYILYRRRFPTHRRGRLVALYRRRYAAD
ncbi:MAG TPA: respiratory nitrate reductase subunit gamma [Solirubrobacteraceae bacterium]|nr:respiratory nitrate reductase subunit gamma [Solirubrobacteraceae bacterium]